MSDLAEFEGLDELQELRRALLNAQVKMRTQKAKTADLIEAVYQAAKDAALAFGKPPAVPRPKADRRTKQAEIAMLMLSDWHFGKQTSSFNSVVAAERIVRLGEKVDQIAAIERADHPVQECHALIAGDFVENVAIFPGQPWEVDSSLFEQLFAARYALAKLVRQLLATFQTVHVWEQTGNHGRLGRKGDHPREDNADAVAYQMARDMLGEYETSGRLVWHPRVDWYSVVEAGAYRALLVHGEQIKSFGGNVPAYGILRKSNAWASGVLPSFRDVYMGHFHQAMVLQMANGTGRVFVNPSIESDSPFAKEFVAATGVPAQRLNFVDPEKGRVTAERVIWLD